MKINIVKILKAYCKETLQGREGYLFLDKGSQWEDIGIKESQVIRDKGLLIEIVDIDSNGEYITLKCKTNPTEML